MRLPRVADPLADVAAPVVRVVPCVTRKFQNLREKMRRERVGLGARLGRISPPYRRFFRIGLSCRAAFWSGILNKCPTVA